MFRYPSLGFGSEFVQQLAIFYLHESDNVVICWPLIGQAIRLAQDVGMLLLVGALHHAQPHLGWSPSFSRTN